MSDRRTLGVSRPTDYALPGHERFLLLGLSLLLLATMSGMVVRSSGDADFWFSLLGVTCVLLFPLVRSGMIGRFDPFEPVYIVNIAYFLYFVYAPAKDHLGGNDFFMGRDMLPLVPRGMTYLTVGLVSMMIGYYSGMGRDIARATRSPGPMREHAVYYAWAAAAVGVIFFGMYVRITHVSFTYFLSLGQSGSGDTWMGVAVEGQSPLFSYFMGGIDFLPGALLIWYAATRVGRKWNVLTYVAVLLVYTTIGFRFRILILLMAPAVYYFLRAGRRPRLLTLLGPASAVAVVIGVIGQFRTNIRAGTRVELEQASVESAGEQFQGDLGIYQPYLALVDAFPRDHDYTWGTSFTYLLVHPIPRALWNNKPEAPVFEIIRAAFGGDEAGVKMGVAYPNIGEYYANFGLAGVVFGMMALGLAMRTLYEYLRRHGDNDWVRIIFALALPFLVQVVSRGYFVQIFQQGCFFFGPVMFGMWALRRRERFAARRARIHRLATTR